MESNIIDDILCNSLDISENNLPHQLVKEYKQYDTFNYWLNKFPKQYHQSIIVIPVVEHVYNKHLEKQNTPLKEMLERQNEEYQIFLL